MITRLSSKLCISVRSTENLFSEDSIIVYIARARLQNEERKLKIPKVSFGSVSLSLYSTLGLCVLLLSNSLWYEGSLELRLPAASDYEFTIEKSERGSLTSIVIFFLILVVTLFFEKRISCLIHDQKAKTRLPFVAAVINTVFTFGLYILIIYSLIGKFVFSGSSLIFDFTVAGIVGMSTYIHLTLPFWEGKRIEKHGSTSEIEALKLEYDWCWKIINAIYWAAIIVVVSSWFFWWNQYAGAVIPLSEWGSFAVQKLTTAIALQMIYIGLGLWFGIIGKLVGLSRRIPDQMRACKVE